MPTASSPSRSSKPGDVLYSLPDSLRDELAQVVGTILDVDGVKELYGKTMLLVVGDVSALNLYKAGLEPKLAVVDYKTKRGGEGDWRSELEGFGSKVVRVRNPQATITRGLWEAVKAAIDGPGTVLMEVQGEEDLASLACIHHAPLGATVIYGIPDVGMMALAVDEALRMTVNEVLKKMEE